MKLFFSVLLMSIISFSCFAQTGKLDRVKKNNHFDLEIFLEPLWTNVKDRNYNFPKTTIITLSLIPVKDSYFKLCKQVPYIVDALIMELNKNPPTQKQLETIERADYSAHLTKIAKQVIQDPKDLFSIEMIFGVKKDIPAFQRREARSCASGRIKEP